MRLWTYHADDFSLLDGRVDHSKSSYHRDDSIMRAYQRLWPVVDAPDGQIIWCCQSRDDWIVVKRQVEWELEVPVEHVLRFIDGMVWCRIIQPGQSNAWLHRSWSAKARARYPLEPRKWDGLVAELEEQYHREPEPAGGWWARLFVGADTPSHQTLVTPILRYPIKPEWLIRRQLVTP